MPSPYKEIPITFEKGLVQEIEESLLDIGQASELENWEPSANGALRSRNRYSSITTDGLTAPYNVRGFGSIATGTAVAGAISAPQVVQQDKWPNGDADPVATKTITLNGVNIGNVLVAVVTDNSDLSPTVTAGWTQRAISTGNRQHVKFYTHTADASTEAFTYTITQSRIRSVIVYEIKYLDAEDPGDKWAAQSVTSGSGGSDNLTVNAVDTDGGLALVGYLYDGGTPNSSDSGTAGYDTPVLDNSNTRTGVTFQDLDQLDGSDDTNGAASHTYITPSWTPPSSGVVIVMACRADAGATNTDTMTVTGNGLTWHDCYDGGELGDFDNSNPTQFIYAWADCSAVVGTTGSITVVASGSPMDGMMCHFVLAIGADTVDPFVQIGTHSDLTGGGLEFGGATLAALQPGSGVIGLACMPVVSGADVLPTAVVGAGDWESVMDSMSVSVTGATATSRSAFSSSAHAPDTLSRWQYHVITSGMYSVAYEIRGQGNASRHYRDVLTGACGATRPRPLSQTLSISTSSWLWLSTRPRTRCTGFPGMKSRLGRGS